MYGIPFAHEKGRLLRVWGFHMYVYIYYMYILCICIHRSRKKTGVIFDLGYQALHPPRTSTKSRKSSRATPWHHRKNFPLQLVNSKWRDSQWMIFMLIFDDVSWLSLMMLDDDDDTLQRKKSFGEKNTCHMFQPFPIRRLICHELFLSNFTQLPKWPMSKCSNQAPLIFSCSSAKAPIFPA